MKNTRKFIVCTLLVGLVFVAVAPGRGQQSGTVLSLGEIARQLKVEREKEKHKPVTVYTNDNLPSQASLGIATLKLEEGAKEKEQATAKGLAAVPAAEEHGEKYFRSQADNIRSRMELHQRQLAVLKQQLGLARMQYYPDPQKTLEQESTPAFQADVDKLRAKIANAEKAVADDQKAMDDLQQELRRASGNPGWIR
jgi:flagellar biosynthesis chaperone FliJ